jgi:hypothetical protein
VKQQIFILRYDNNTQDEGFEKISDSGIDIRRNIAF